MSNSSGRFSVDNGQIIDPNGNTFVAHGIDVMEGNQPSAATLQQDFPGINFVRLAVFDYASPDALASYVNDLTSHGIVVELEDHNNNAGNAGGTQGQIFTGQALDTELNWYSAVAGAFKDNPNVWFGTNNEPSEIDASGNTNPGALSDWQKATYDTVRGAGNANPVLLEANGWDNNGQPVMIQGYNAADYAGMTNTIWDVHYYGWLTGYSTDQAANDSFLNQMVQQVQQVPNADGTMAVLVGEYGNSTTGASIDANGDQVIQAVQDSGLSSAAWAWCQGNPGDGLINGDGSLSAYGQQVAAAIAAGGGSSAPAVAASASTDAPAAASASSSVAATPTAVDTLTLRVSEDAYQGDAKFTVSVDGHQVGGTLAASALHATGSNNVFVLSGNWGQGSHDVDIRFINDAYGQSATADRNLYVDSIGYDGTTYANTSARLMTSGSDSFTVGGDTASATAPADTLTLHLSEDAWNGDATFTLSIDGKQIGAAEAVVASHSAGEWQDVTFSGNFGAGPHDVGIGFNNDASSGSPPNDRNLYIGGVEFNGTHYGSGETALYSNGVAHFTV